MNSKSLVTISLRLHQHHHHQSEQIRIKPLAISFWSPCKQRLVFPFTIFYLNFSFCSGLPNGICLLMVLVVKCRWWRTASTSNEHFYAFFLWLELKLPVCKKVAPFNVASYSCKIFLLSSLHHLFRFLGRLLLKLLDNNERKSMHWKGAGCRSLFTLRK